MGRERLMGWKSKQERPCCNGHATKSSVVVALTKTARTFQGKIKRGGKTWALVPVRSRNFWTIHRTSALVN